MKLTEACIQKPVFAWMLMAATIVFGLVAGSQIGISQFPDVDFPTINVGVSWEGAAPEAVESDIIEPLEEAVLQVEGVKAITSSARQGGGNINIELDIDRDVDLALQDVQAKVNQAQNRLPRDADPPITSKQNPEDQPILWVGTSGPFAQQVVSDFARYRLKEKLQTVPGVGEVQLGGSLDRNVRIWVDADKLDAKGLTVTDLTNALRREHVELPAGRIETEGREVNVRVMGEALDLATLRRIVVREQNGQPVYLEDVALVEDGFEDVRRMARVNGEPAQGLGIKKQRGANAVAVAEGVYAKIEELRRDAPPGMEISVINDLMTSIATMMAAVPAAIGLGAGSETRRPMAVAVLGGLLLSTFLSLLVVPAFYLVADRAKQRLSGRKADLSTPPEKVAPGASTGLRDA